MRATPARVYVRATAAPGRQDDRSLTRGACWSDRQAGPLLPAATGAVPCPLIIIYQPGHYCKASARRPGPLADHAHYFLKKQIRV